MANFTKEEAERVKLRPDDGKFKISDLKIDESRRRVPRRRWLRWLVLLFLVGAAIVGALFLKRQQAPEVETVEARPVPNERVTLLNASGYVTPRRRATVAAKTTGRLEQVLVDEGMRVETNQKLATLDDTDTKVRLDSAEAEVRATRSNVADLEVNLANAERDLQRARELSEAGITTAQNLDKARTAVDSLHARIASTKTQVAAAEARVAVARQDLENTIIRAPFAGMVVSKDAQRGEMVSPISAGGGFTRTGIATIVDMSSLEIEVDVNESYIARVKPGQPVNAVLDAYPEWQIPGKVRTVIPTADRQKATVKVRVSFDELDPRILPDMGVKVSFLGEKPAAAANPNAVLVPKEAVREQPGGPVVFVYRENHVESRKVTVGEARAAELEILSGITAGDQVLSHPPQEVKDGQRVKLKK